MTKSMNLSVKVAKIG